MKQWLHEIDRYASENVNKLLVGNKCDLVDKRKITQEMGKELAETINIDFVETSAKASTNVELAFVQMSMQIKTRSRSQPLGGSKGAGRTLSPGQAVNQKGSGGCC